MDLQSSKSHKLIAQLLLCAFLFQNCEVNNPPISLPSTKQKKSLISVGSRNVREKEKIKDDEEEMEQSAYDSQINYENLLKSAKQGNPEAQFLLGKRAYEAMQNQYIKGTDNLQPLMEESVGWLSQAGIQNYKPAVDLIESFGIKFTTSGKANKNFEQTSYKEGNKGVSIKQGEMMPPFSYLYPLEKGRVSTECFEDYCTKLFQPINSFETYDSSKLYAYISNLIHWIDGIINKSSLRDIEYSISIYIIRISTILSLHIENILNADCFSDFPLENKLELLDKFHWLVHHIAATKLNIVACSNDRSLIQQYVKGYRETKDKLRTRFGIPKERVKTDYLKKLDDIYQMILITKPHIDIYFNPQQQKGLISRRSVPSQRQKEFKKKRQRDLLRKVYKSSVPATPAREFSMKQQDFFTLFTDVVLKLKGINQGQILKNAVEKCSKNFLELEQFAFSLISSTINKPTVIDLLTSMPKLDIDIYEFMRDGIRILTLANKFKQALLRLEAMEIFYSSRPSPKNFKVYQALDYAACGQYEKLSKLYEKVIRQQLKKKKKLQEKHQQKLEMLQSSLNAQSSSGSSNPVTTKLVEREQALDTFDLTGNNVEVGESEATYRERQKSLAQAKEDRYKRHQEAENERRKKQLFEAATTDEEVQTDRSKELEIVTQSQVSVAEYYPPIHFALAKKAFRTVSQIFDNDWKISRIDIENLFNELGQTINTATKSSHHIINIPSGIALVNQEGQIIGMATSLSATVGGHLSLPNWDKEVPFYMRSQIQKLLEVIGINKENYSKGNRDGGLQFVADQTNKKEDLQAVSSSEPVASKQNKRSKKKNRVKANS
jgi:hypothetical protein